jgi:hypothetical protein
MCAGPELWGASGVQLTKLEGVRHANERNDIGSEAAVVDSYRGISNQDEFLEQADLASDRDCVGAIA